jgi:hypothetical protein
MNLLPRGLRRLVWKRQEDLYDQAENFIISNQELIGILGWPSHEVKRQNEKRPTQVG